MVNVSMIKSWELRDFDFARGCHYVLYAYRIFFVLAPQKSYRVAHLCLYTKTYRGKQVYMY